MPMPPMLARSISGRISFRTVLIASPLRDERPPGGTARRSSDRTSRLTRSLKRGERPRARRPGQALRVPYLVYRLLRSVAGADAIHVRCPGNLGLLGALVAPLGGVPVVAKYAGNWIGYPGEPWSLRFQRAVLRSLVVARARDVLRRVARPAGARGAVLHPVMNRAL